MTLAANTDELTMLLLETEDALQRLGYGVSAKVPMGPEHHLSYEKHGAGWGLYCHYPDGAMSPIAKASRKLRVLAADALSSLYGALLDAVAAQDAAVVEAIAKVRAVNARLAAAIEERSETR